MQIKRYSAPDMRRALHLVRQAQGSQAVILSSRRLPDGVEVIAADEYDAALVERLAAGDGAALPAGSGRELPSAGQGDLPGPADLDRLAWAVDPAIAQLRSELTTLRSLLEAELRQSALARRSPLQAQLAQYLEQLGLAAPLIGSLLEQLTETQDLGAAWREVLGQHLSARIPIAPDDMLTEGGVVAVLGPPGGGQTPPVAKQA
jgi:flagellar biosynthesis protein FlhF